MSVSKYTLLDKALVLALARGILAVCIMWAANSFKKCVIGKK